MPTKHHDFPDFLISSRNSRENCSRRLLNTYFRELEKVPDLVIEFRELEKLKRFQPKGKIETGKPNIKLVFLWFRYDLEFGSCLLKAK
jgi:hypothetical protein